MRETERELKRLENTLEKMEGQEGGGAVALRDAQRYENKRRFQNFFVLFVYYYNVPDLSTTKRVFFYYIFESILGSITSLTHFYKIVLRMSIFDYQCLKHFQFFSHHHFVTLFDCFYILCRPFLIRQLIVKLFHDFSTICTSL